MQTALQEYAAPVAIAFPDMGGLKGGGTRTLNNSNPLIAIAFLGMSGLLFAWKTIAIALSA